MTWKQILSTLALSVLLLSCAANTEATKQRLLESGNRYFEQGKYREAAIVYMRAIREDRRFGEAYYRLGLAELRLGRMVQMVQAMQRAVELQPENDDAFGLLSEVYISAYLLSPPSHSQKILTDLRDLLDRAEKQNADSYEILRVKGYIALADKEYEKAHESFRAAANIQPGDLKTTVALIQTLILMDRSEEAEEIGMKAIEIDPSAGLVYDSLYAYFVRRKQAEKAAKIILLKCENNPDEMSFKLQLAAHYHRTGQPEERDKVLEEILDRPDRAPDVHLRLGDFLVRIGDRNRAIEMFRSGIEADTGDNEALRLRIVDSLSLEGRTQEALHLVDEVLENDPDNAEAIAIRAALRLQGGDRETVQAAINDFEAVVASMPGNAVLRYNYGRAFLAADQMDRALVQFQEAANLRADYIAPRIYLGQIYLAKAQPSMAAQLAEEVLAIDPESVRGRLLRASAAIGLKEFHQGRAQAESVLRDYPNNLDARYLLANLDFAEKNYQGAEEILKRLRASAPEDPRSIQGLINVYMAQGKPKQAQEMLDAELEQRPESRTLRLTAARIATAANDHDRAIAEYGYVLQQDPSSVDVQVALGTAYYRAQRFDKAEQHYRRAKEIQPKSLSANLRLALLLGEIGQMEETGRILNDVIKMAPDNPVALNNMAYLLSESPASLDTALTLAQRAMSRAPGNPTISDTLGWIYIKKNLSDNAIQIYQDLVNRFPNHPTWRYHLAMALFQKGDKPQARRECQRAIANGPSRDEEKKIRELLAQLGS